MGYNQLSLNLRPINSIPSIFNQCNIHSVSYTKCILNDINRLLNSVKRKSGILGIRDKDLTICISDPNEIINSNIRYCLRNLLCKIDSKTQGMCPDIIICYNKICVFIELKSHVSSKKRLSRRTFLIKH